MKLVSNIGQLITMDGVLEKQGRRIESSDLSIIDNAAMVVKDQGKKSQITWVGSQSDLPTRYKKLKAVDAKGKVVLPGLIDSHTHLVFGGDRSAEFEMRLAGKSYQSIAKEGGGILNTMNATRSMSLASLEKLALARTEEFLKQGVTTVEVKTGYGLDFESEKKCLQVIKNLKSKSKINILSTFLGAHSVPPEYQGQREEYVDLVANTWLPKLAKLCDFVDVFVDRGYFSKENGTLILQKAQKLGIPGKVHADELALTGGSELAVEQRALSADHLLKIKEEQIGLLANSEVTATLLPTTALYLKEAYSPARKLLDAGARVALATDYNPGTSPTQDLSLVALLGALEMGMRTEEILAGLTVNGAYALGLESEKGALVPGYDAEFFMFDGASAAQIFYLFGKSHNPVTVFCGGKFHRGAK